MKRGDFVRVTYGETTVTAMVMLSSPNGASLMLGFDGLLPTQNGGAFFGSMPVLRDERGVYRDLIEGEPVQMEPASREDMPQ